MRYLNFRAMFIMSLLNGGDCRCAQDLPPQARATCKDTRAPKRSPSLVVTRVSFQFYIALRGSGQSECPVS